MHLYFFLSNKIKAVTVTFKDHETALGFELSNISVVRIFWSLLEFAFLVQNCAAISDAGRESTWSEALTISDGDLYYG